MRRSCNHGFQKNYDAKKNKAVPAAAVSGGISYEDAEQKVCPYPELCRCGGVRRCHAERGCIAAEVDSTCVEGYLPPQEQMVQGDIALHSGDVAVGEKDPSYGGYGAPEGNPIQGDIMLISGDELAGTAKTEARYTVKGLLGKQLLYTARQKDSVLTLDVPAEVATFAPPSRICRPCRPTV